MVCRSGALTVSEIAAAGLPALFVPFLAQRSSAVLEWADVVVCRSGALTVSEIAAAGLPALFVPFLAQR
ncbi:UDP-N-acetylglucosamine--N-acetylmuramyl-(pentapeptide) pyrophosphoryl-undecaprenol N-acetylglucosamine transferase, partial [Klebsiella pneumoniae]